MPESGRTTPPGGSPRPPEASCLLPCHPRSVGRARAALRGRLAGGPVSGEAAESAELVLSELVTNAYRHGRVPGRGIGVRVSVQCGTLRLEVSDAGGGRPVRAVADGGGGGAGDGGGRGAGDGGGSDAGSGEGRRRGLCVVDALADDWGVEPRPYGIGKSVWAVIRLAGPPGGRC